MDKYIALSCWNKLAALPCFYVINEVFAVCCGAIFKDVKQQNTLVEWQAVTVHPFLESCPKVERIRPQPQTRGEGGQFPEKPPAAPAVRAHHSMRLSVGKADFPCTLPSALPDAAIENDSKGRCLFFLLLLRREWRKESRRMVFWSVYFSFWLHKHTRVFL